MRSFSVRFRLRTGVSSSLSETSTMLLSTIGLRLAALGLPWSSLIDRDGDLLNLSEELRQEAIEVDVKSALPLEAVMGIPSRIRTRSKVGWMPMSCAIDSARVSDGY